ncbi:hypothetical protein [Paludibaculum fermentans]|uniref:hypothetical protein n=1 Tax=Paludibaculum fermentans TaxID=1473598 RepID=UPI003EBA0FC5
MDKNLRAVLANCIRKVCLEKARIGEFQIDDAATQVIRELSTADGGEWKVLCDHFAERGVTRYVKKEIARTRPADSAQLSLPGLESLPLLVLSDRTAIFAQQLVYDRYRAELRRLERKIESYKYKRRKSEYLEQDIRQLEEMKRFDPRFSQYAAEDPGLTLGEAKRREGKDQEAQSSTRGRRMRDSHRPGRDSHREKSRT